MDGHGDDEENGENSSRKRSKNRAVSMSLLSSIQLKSEVVKVIEDKSKSARKKRNWMQTRAIELVEQQVSHQCPMPSIRAGEAMAEYFSDLSVSFSPKCSKFDFP
ncbi:hypothetical protein V6N13_121541 [Hibiscus sabdariffa]